MSKYIVKWLNNGNEKVWNTDSNLDASMKFVMAQHRGNDVTATKNGELFKKFTSIPECQDDNDGCYCNELEIITFIVGYMKDGLKKTKSFPVESEAMNAYNRIVKTGLPVYFAKSINDRPAKVIKTANLEVINK